jgi:hypothetical protein
VKPQIELIRSYLVRHQFLVAMALVVGITAILTTLSMVLYIQSGASGLDLSRPGFVGSRNDLQKDASTEFESTGELSEADIKTFQKLYQDQRTILNSLSDFDDDAISDESLGLNFDNQATDAPQ